MKELFDPITIGNMECKNRLLRSATWEGLADAKGHMSEAQYEIYEALAKNEAGLICTGYARIMEDEQPNAGMMGIYDDCFIPDYQRLTDSVHAHGAKIMMQLAYGGTKTTYQTGERNIFAPSDVPEVSTGTQGTPMTKEDISLLVSAYAQAARRVKESGFDAVQIHGGHSYLLNQFLSPYYNRRTDEYGGSLENRMRIIAEIYLAMRRETGYSFPILIKITCSDFMEGALTFPDVRAVCFYLEQLGMDGFEISGNIHGKAHQMIGMSFDGHTIARGGYFLDYAKVIAEEVQVPVYVTGGFEDMMQMEQWLNESEIAGFGLCRPLLAEPDLFLRWKSRDITAAKYLHCSKCRTSNGNYCTVFQK